MNKYIVSVWPGVGYYTKQIEVDAYSEDEALESASVIAKKWACADSILIQTKSMKWI